MVFAASCMPWPSAIAAAETVCAIRKPRLSRPGLGLAGRSRGWPASRGSRARSRPSATATIGMTTLSTTPSHCTVAAAGAAPAPTRPPISACEDDDGRPKYQVMQVPGDRADQRRRRPRPGCARPAGRLDQPVADGLGDLGAEEGADEVARPRPSQRDPRGQRPGGDRGRDGVGRVVEAVGVVEDQRRSR